KNGFSRLEQTEDDYFVGCAARVRLYIGVFGTESHLGSVDGQLLYFIDDLASRVESMARVALRSHIANDPPLAKKDRRISHAGRSNHSERVGLTEVLSTEQSVKVRIQLSQTFDTYACKLCKCGFTHCYSSEAVWETFWNLMLSRA